MLTRWDVFVLTDNGEWLCVGMCLDADQVEQVTQVSYRSEKCTLVPTGINVPLEH